MSNSTDRTIGRRLAFVEGDGQRIHRVARRYEAHAGVMVVLDDDGTGAPDDVTLDLCVTKNGDWSLVARRYGRGPGGTIASGTIEDIVTAAMSRSI